MKFHLYSNKFILFSVVLFQAICFSQTKLPSFFCDNMVLQQDDAVAIWGTDKPNTLVSIKTTWGKRAKTTSNADGEWKLTVKTPLASYT